MGYYPFLSNLNPGNKNDIYIHIIENDWYLKLLLVLNYIIYYIDYRDSFWKIKKIYMARNFHLNKLGKFYEFIFLTVLMWLL